MATFLFCHYRPSRGRIPSILRLAKASGNSVLPITTPWWHNCAMSDERRYTIDELSQLTGVPPRTVRLYVQRGLVPPAAGRGRGSHYGDEHLAGIQRVQDLKRAGKTLDDVRDTMLQQEGTTVSQEDAPQRRRRRILLAEEGIWLEVGPGVALPTPDALDNLAALCRRELGLPDKDPVNLFTIVSQLGTFLVIPDGLPEGQALKIAPGERRDIEIVTPALKMAESNGQITILRQPE